MSISIGDKTIGIVSGEQPVSTLPPSMVYDDRTVDEHIQYLLERMQDMQNLVQGMVPKDGIRTAIKYSDEAILIQATDIVLFGDVTFANWRANIAGLASDLDIGITRITGDVIRTGAIQGNAWSTTQGIQIDLNNDIIQVGGSDDPSLYFENGDLTISGTLTADSIIIGDSTSAQILAGALVDQHALAYSLQQALENSGSVVLKGVIVPTDSGALKTGSITWNSATGALTGGTGVAITEWGIIGAVSGVASFSIAAATGAAVFAGSLSAATGTFAGSLSAATGTFAGSLSAATGTFAGSLSAATGTFAGSVTTSGSIVGYGSSSYSSYSATIIGYSTGSTTAVLGRSNSGYGGRFISVSGTACICDAGSGLGLHVTSGAIRLDGQPIGGTAPTANRSMAINLNGTTYYILMSTTP